MTLESDVAELKTKMATVLEFLGEIGDKIDVCKGRRESQRRSNISLNSSSQMLISPNIIEGSSLTKRKIFDVSTKVLILSSKSLIRDFENEEEIKWYREKRKRKENTFDLLACSKIIPKYRDTW